MEKFKLISIIEGIENCQKISQDIELTFINGGVMYNNKPFYKIK